MKLTFRQNFVLTELLTDELVLERGRLPLLSS